MRKPGFATMDKDKLREIASRGGKAKVAKGFARMDKEVLLEVSKRGGRIASERRDGKKGSGVPEQETTA